MLVRSSLRVHQILCNLDVITSLFSRTAKIADICLDFEVLFGMPTPDQLK